MIQHRVDEILEDLKQQGLEEKYGYAGIYCIQIEDKLVYIGKARNMLVRLAQHIGEIEKSKSKNNKYKVLHQAYTQGHQISFDVLYTSSLLEQTDIDEDIGYREAQFINKYLPVLNYQIPNQDNYKSWTANKLAKTITLKEILK